MTSQFIKNNDWMFDVLGIPQKKPSITESSIKQYDPKPLRIPPSDRSGAVPILLGTRIIPGKLIFYKDLGTIKDTHSFHMFIAFNMATRLEAPKNTLQRLWFNRQLIYTNPGTFWEWDASKRLTVSDKGNKYFSANVTFGADIRINLGSNIVQDVNVSYRGIAVLYLYFCKLEVGKPLPIIECEIKSEYDIINDAMSPTDRKISKSGNFNTPASHLYDILISSSLLDLDIYSFDAESFIDAHKTLLNESNFSNVFIPDISDVANIINNLLIQMDGILYINPSDGVIYLKLIREIDLTEDTPIVDESNIIEFINYRAGTWGEVASELTVTYFDSQNKYKRSDVTRKSTLGQGVKSTIVLPYCTNKNIAEQILTRYYNRQQIPKSVASINVTRQLIENLFPGDIILLSWKKYNIEKQKMRITSINYGTLEDGKIGLDLIEEE